MNLVSRHLTAQAATFATAALSLFSFNASGSAEAQQPEKIGATRQQDIPTAQEQRNIGIAIATLFKAVPEFGTDIQKMADDEVIKVTYANTIGTNLLSAGQVGMLTNIGVLHKNHGTHEIIFSRDSTSSAGRALVLGALAFGAVERAEHGSAEKNNAREWQALVKVTIPRCEKVIAQLKHASSLEHDLGGNGLSSGVTDAEAALKELKAVKFPEIPGLKAP